MKFTFTGGQSPEDYGSEMPRLHERHAVVRAAENDIGGAVLDAIQKHDLTYGEIFSILASQMQNWAKYAIRDERHPGEDKKGDEA